MANNVELKYIKLYTVFCCKNIEKNKELFNINKILIDVEVHLMNNSKNSNYEKLKNIKSKKGTKIAILACLSTAVVGTVAVKAIQTSIEEKKVSIEENKIIEMQKQK